MFVDRATLYENYVPSALVCAVRAAAGYNVMVPTNGANSTGEPYGPGQEILFRDHLNLMDASPLAEPQPSRGIASRFLDQNGLYSLRLRVLACSLDVSLEEGVYACLSGPHCETLAEVAMLRRLRADLWGCRRCSGPSSRTTSGPGVLRLSLLTNHSARVTRKPVGHEALAARGGASAALIGALMRCLVEHLS